MTRRRSYSLSSARCLAAVLIGFLGLVARADTIMLDAPDETKKAELDQCSAAMGKRLAALGIKGLKVSAVQKDGKSRVELSLATEIPKDIRDKILKVAKFPGQKVGIQSQMSEADATKDGGKAPCSTAPEGKDPPGGHWLKCIGLDLAPDAGYRPVADAPIAAWTECAVAKKEKSTWSFDFTPASTKVLQDLASGQGDVKSPVSKLILVIDGHSLSTSVEVALFDKGRPRKNGTLTVSADLAELVDAIGRNPMPRALKAPEPQKPEEKK